MSENAAPPPAAGHASSASGPDLAELIYVELLGRAFMRVENTASVKPDAAILARLSLELAETYRAAKREALAALGPKNVGYDVKLDDLMNWEKK
ncbi:MAG: hypothetical protein EXR28_17820 [Betaproteobacteria bacterium]|nr:hypothetical protein [Betaproteobacteria bacterium]